MRSLKLIVSLVVLLVAAAIADPSYQFCTKKFKSLNATPVKDETKWCENIDNDIFWLCDSPVPIDTADPCAPDVQGRGSWEVQCVPNLTTITVSLTPEDWSECSSHAPQVTYVCNVCSVFNEMFTCDNDNVTFVGGCHNNCQNCRPPIPLQLGACTHVPQIKQFVQLGPKIQHNSDLSEVQYFPGSVCDSSSTSSEASNGAHHVYPLAPNASCFLNPSTRASVLKVWC